jgi:hypothetical protein
MNNLGFNYGVYISGTLYGSPEVLDFVQRVLQDLGAIDVFNSAKIDVYSTHWWDHHANGDCNCEVPDIIAELEDHYVDKLNSLVTEGYFGWHEGDFGFWPYDEEDDDG